MRETSVVWFAVLVMLAMPDQVWASGFCVEEGLCTTAPMVASEVQGQVGYFANGFVDPAGGGFAYNFAQLAATGRLRLLDGPERGQNLGLILDVGAFGHIPVSPFAAVGTGGSVRVGLGFSQVAFTLGAYMRYDFLESTSKGREPAPDTANFVLLPSLTVTWRPGDWALTLGLFDRFDGGNIARLTFEYGNFGIGWVGLLGAEVFYRLGLTDSIALEARAYGTTTIAGAYSAGGTLGVVFGRGATFSF